MTYHLHRLYWLARTRLTAAIARADRDTAVWWGAMLAAGIVIATTGSVV